METNIRYTIVGLFVIVLLSFITLAIIWLSSGFSIKSYDVYQVNMRESVSGLSIDGAVEYNGVNVGTIKSIQINPGDHELVELLLRVDHATPITQDTTATINMRGLTGVTFVSLRDKGESNAKIKILPGNQYPIIKTTPSLLTRFDQALTDLNVNFKKISLSIEKLFDDENLSKIKEILKNLQSVTKNLTPMMTQGLETIEIFNRETLPKVNDAISNIDNVTNDVSSLASELKENPSVILRGKSPPRLGPGEK
ncbi:MlaD family protein [Gammaproteobacteria bacterium]|nr:MlaD family protein [Gammaproteobacteria bacterium]